MIRCKIKEISDNSALRLRSKSFFETKAAQDNTKKRENQPSKYAVRVNEKTRKQEQELGSYKSDAKRNGPNIDTQEEENRTPPELKQNDFRASSLLGCGLKFDWRAVALVVANKILFQLKENTETQRQHITLHQPSINSTHRDQHPKNFAQLALYGPGNQTQRKA